MGGKNFIQGEGIHLEITRARFSNVLKRHAELADRISRNSDKLMYERLQKEFEVAKASQTQEICLNGEQWNNGLLAALRERVHMDAERKIRPGDSDIPYEAHFQKKTTYSVGNKMICCLEGARIGIQYETFFAGELCELYHCVLQSKSFLDKMTVHEHTIPFFLPMREAEADLLSSNAIKFIDHIGDLLQAYVDRREQVNVMKEVYGNQIVELYHSLPYHLVEFAFEVPDCKITISLRYDDLVSVLPTCVKVVAWPLHPPKRIRRCAMEGKKNEGSGSPLIPAHLTYAEDALRTLSLAEAYAEIKLNLPEALLQVFPKVGHP